MIYDNCTIFTMDPERRILTDAAVAVDGTTIAAVGKSAEVRAARPDDRVRDLKGWLVVPGIVDVRADVTWSLDDTKLRPPPVDPFFPFTPR